MHATNTGILTKDKKFVTGNASIISTVDGVVKMTKIGVYQVVWCGHSPGQWLTDIGHITIIHSTSI